MHWNDPLAIVAALAQIDPTGGLGDLAREGGPWVFGAVVGVLSAIFFSRQTIAAERRRADEWKQVADTTREGLLAAVAELKTANELVRAIERTADERLRADQARG